MRHRKDWRTKTVASTGILPSGATLPTKSLGALVGSCGGVNVTTTSRAGAGPWFVTVVVNVRIGPACSVTVVEISTSELRRSVRTTSIIADGSDIFFPLTAVTVAI